jgi:hypothetical protein
MSKWTTSRKEGRRVFQVTFVTHIAVDESSVVYRLQNEMKQQNIAPEQIDEVIDGLLRHEVSNIAEKINESSEVVASDWDIMSKPIEDTFSVEHVIHPRTEVEEDPGYPDIGIPPAIVQKED